MGGWGSGSAMWIGKGGQGKLTLLERLHLSREAQGWGFGGAAGYAEDQSLFGHLCLWVTTWCLGDAGTVLGDWRMKDLVVQPW